MQQNEWGCVRVRTKTLNKIYDYIAKQTLKGNRGIKVSNIADNAISEKLDELLKEV